MKRLCCLFLVLSFSGCSHNQVQTRICGNQLFLHTLAHPCTPLHTLAHSGLGTGRGDNLIWFTTHQDNKTNEYFLQVENEHYFLRRDSLEYASPITKQNVAAYVAALRLRLDSLNIRNYEGQPGGFGMLMKLYLKDGNTVFRTKEIASITDTATLRHIRQAECLCEGWYKGEY